MFNKYRKYIMFFVDLALVCLSVYLAFMIRFDWQITDIILDDIIFFTICASVIRVTLFVLFGFYQWSFRFASISELLNLFRMITVGSLLLIAIAFFSHKSGHVGRSVLLIDYLICFFLIGASRFLPRVLIKFKWHSNKGLKKVLIIGAGSAGVMVCREMLVANKRIYKPIGFIDDNPTKVHSKIHGIKVLGKTSHINKIIKNNNVEEIVIAIPSATGKVIRDIILRCEKTEAKIKIIPGLHKILTGEISIKRIRDVEPEDLLGREVVEIDTKDLTFFIKEKTILITGAGGSIGSELCRQIAKFDPKLLILYDYNENDTYFMELELKGKYPHIKLKTIIGDIKDIALLKHTFSQYKPKIVFHAAAHKHVPLMEENPIASVKNNVIGTRNLMYAAEHYKVESFIMISTDKAVNPTNIMGASKRIAEQIIQAKAKIARTKFIAVRFGNVIGSNGSVIPIFRRQIQDGGPVTVTHSEVKRYFMTASEAAQLVLQAGAIGKNGEILILDMGEQIRIIDLAKNLIALSGFELDEDIKIKFIGLRPGEKMKEEMLLDVEHDKATKHDKIYIAQPSSFNLKKLNRDIRELERLANLMSNSKVVEKIREMVPNYSPNGSKR
ncbi:MAG: nucleoside-diphosphate sugar epimerase/dehydratase [Candidatus Orphnella occulta]|nr:nucleoside-diphosphate sugar epimerase/dehydratase [Candidatus Orphnella occulta]